jgi:hypothetical protein
MRFEVSTDAYSVSGVAGGLWDDEGEAALLAFEGGAGPVSLVLPACELLALLRICLDLAGQTLASGEGVGQPAAPLADWRVAVNAERDVILELAADAGGPLAFNIDHDQAQALARALDQAVQAADVIAPSAVRISSGH